MYEPSNSTSLWDTKRQTIIFWPNSLFEEKHSQINIGNEFAFSFHGHRLSGSTIFIQTCIWDYNGIKIIVYFCLICFFFCKISSEISCCLKWYWQRKINHVTFNIWKLLFYYSILKWSNYASFIMSCIYICFS